MRAVFSTIPSFLPGDRLGEEPLPLGVGELDLVQRLELGAQVGLQRGGADDRQVLVGLPLEQLDERRFQLGLALVAALLASRPARTPRRPCSRR